MAEYGNLNPEPKPQKPYEYAPIGIDPNNYDFNKMPHWTALIGVIVGIAFLLVALTMEVESSIHQIYQVLHYIGGWIMILLGGIGNILHNSRKRK